MTLIARIKAVLDGETLDDPPCFFRIEAIVEAFQTAGLPVRLPRLVTIPNAAGKNLYILPFLSSPEAGKIRAYAVLLPWGRRGIVNAVEQGRPLLFSRRTFARRRGKRTCVSP